MTKGQFEEGLRVMKKQLGEDSSLHAILRKEISEHNCCDLILEGGYMCFTAYDEGIFVNDRTRRLIAYIPYDEIIALKY